MRLFERAALAAFHRLDPEHAHDLALKALRTPFAPRPGPVTSDRLRTRLAGLDIPNPIGLAAGFDKNAAAVAPLMQAGFGFVEVGAATPLPQPGNPKPRLFRLAEDRAVINRFGFNNDGAEAIVDRMAKRPTGIPVGLNIGANKTSDDRARDYATVSRTATAVADFLTVNVSSPNTENLRDLQGIAALEALLDGVMRARQGTPVFLKIAPDMGDAELQDIVYCAESTKVDAIIATNTTVSRNNLRSANRSQAGGLSGQPLFALSTRVLARLAGMTALPLIGVGGVGSAQQAFDKITAGASAVQLYSSLVYNGLGSVPRMAEKLDGLLAAKGFSSVDEARGTQQAAWSEA